MSPDESSGTSQPTRLTAFIKANRNEIVAAWEVTVRSLPVARDLARPVLVDHIPDLLERICEIADRVGAGREPSLPIDIAELHARERLEEGFDLAQVVTEYRMLRACILQMWARQVVDPAQLTDLRALDEAIDISIGASIDRYTKARDRTLRALDRIATEAFGSRNLDELLQRLLHVMKETTSAVDTTAILLREGDLLRVRAAVGLGREVERNLVMKVGEGFAGTVAASAHEVTFGEVPQAKIVSPILRGAGLHALYGVPLIEDGQVIGVAHMGSRTAHEFSTQDKRLFAAMVARATSAIRQHMLYEAAVQASKEAQEREQELQALADNIPQLAWMADPTGARFWYNRRWYEYSGASFEALRGWGWQQFHHPAHVEDVAAKYRHAVVSGEPWEDTYPLRGKDGHYDWFLSRAVPIRNEAGQITRWFGSSTDITETRLMGEISTALTSTLDHDEMIAKIAELAVPDFADWCVVDLVEHDGGFRRAAVAHADPCKAEAARRLQAEYSPRPDRSPGIVGAVRSGEVVHCADVKDEIDRIALDADHAALLRTLGLTSYISTPLLVRGRILGAITFATSKPERRLQRPQVEIARELARRIAICIDNARLYREAQRSTSRRRCCYTAERNLACASPRRRSGVHANAWTRSSPTCSTWQRSSRGDCASSQRTSWRSSS
ncbi:MAG: GAF domain-containing protein [Deltaproteobacteria bacterium]|nr:MAG: GAF domain-containing protein [Deltaproteobacteria bacterium]